MVLSFEEPTRKMREEAASAGFFATPWGDFPRLQLLTIAEILDGKGIAYPRTAGINQTIKPAPRYVRKDAQVLSLGIEGEDELFRRPSTQAETMTVRGDALDLAARESTLCWGDSISGKNS